MTSTIKSIVQAKIPAAHFVLALLIASLICGFLYVLVIPLLFWFILGEGASAERIENYPINTFLMSWLALIITILLCSLRISKKLSTSNFGKAKSFCIVILIITGIYCFRDPIIDSLLSLCP